MMSLDDDGMMDKDEDEKEEGTWGKVGPTAKDDAWESDDDDEDEKEEGDGWSDDEDDDSEEE